MIAFTIAVFCMSSLALLMALDHPNVSTAAKVAYCALYFTVNVFLLGRI